ncbi:hypothetical protein C2G38_2037234 [Gigaspora rosea]|uniref:Uncharacterized protein n=1 Tax=Gigaspora rosea TaxID=44941 RepID=A0A397V9P6_9GLOM|nr:hypothetical protein C2G38_2037234 [Gigaspora rosea]
MSLSQTPRRKRKRVQANDLGVNTGNNHNDIGYNNDLVDNNENGDDNALTVHPIVTANESTAPSSNNDFEENTDPQSPPQDLNQFRQDLNLANHQIQQQQRW